MRLLPFGIYVSHYQGNIAWKKLSEDSLPNKVFFIVLKATQGKTLVDNMFENQFFWIAYYSKIIPKCFSIGKIDPRTNPCASSMKGCWQYSQNGSMKGITGNVDINYMNNYYLSQ
jgi:GH25 family lysozyme M1 (1,4-beta-N-acetylmuramidase)